MSLCNATFSTYQGRAVIEVRKIALVTGFEEHLLKLIPQEDPSFMLQPFAPCSCSVSQELLSTFASLMHYRF